MNLFLESRAPIKKQVQVMNFVKKKSLFKKDNCVLKVEILSKETDYINDMEVSVAFSRVDRIKKKYGRLTIKQTHFISVLKMQNLLLRFSSIKD